MLRAGWCRVGLGCSHTETYWSAYSLKRDQICFSSAGKSRFMGLELGCKLVDLTGLKESHRAAWSCCRLSHKHKHLPCQYKPYSFSSPFLFNSGAFLVNWDMKILSRMSQVVLRVWTVNRSHRQWGDLVRNVPMPCHLGGYKSQHPAVWFLIIINSGTHKNKMY